ncbi:MULTISPECIES: type VI secretion system tube protein Hcp [Cellvibrio]|uniref:Carboxypeptidase regulatory-like domain-containing protein n=1 Tax=Cellvibrio fibrivorans TaxID=126350 RepID=A0ABU1UU82_9GAMM|nr:type VI secretion system tube protein Hcp [Cellvibrio fibrivorans]MDR7088715.1 hypothetical protein [Cellvibrio fibrivorans]
MNKHIRIIVGSFLLSAFAPLAAVAASDMHIKLNDIKGESKIVHCPGGTCTVTGLAAGTYQVQVCDKNGAAVISSTALSHSIKSPRDAASGLATGKRQHKPMIITQQLDKSSPQLFSLVVTEPGSSVTIQPQAVATDGAAPVSSGGGAGKVNVQDISMTR